MNDDDPANEALDARAIHRQVADGGYDGEFFRTVVERVGVGVAVYDDTGTFTYANDAFGDVLDLDRSAVLEKALWEVNPEFEESRFESYWDSFAVGETREHEGTHVRSDGETVPVETVTTAIDVAGTVYHVGTIADISARVADWTEMERQDERLEEFAAVVSHDLRNPLNVAMGRTELAAMECDSDHLEYVERSLLQMEALIGDVLTLAREGSRLADPAPTAVDEAVDAAWYEVATDGATLDVADDLGSVESEGDRLTELFASLFENAIQHGGEDVTVIVGRLEDGFFVADDGPGIPEEDHETVFEYGYTTAEDATGFGLTIVEHIAAAHGWDVIAVDGDDGARIELHGVEFLD